MDLTTLVDYLDERFHPAQWQGDFQNGLIVAGKRFVLRVGVATNSTSEVIFEARQEKVDFLVTHHGAWREIDLQYAEKKRKILQESQISHYVLHAPLDSSPTIGTSRVFAELLGIQPAGRFAEHLGYKIGIYGLVEGLSFDQFCSKIVSYSSGTIFQSKNRVGEVGCIGVVAGAGDRTNYLEEAHNLGCDTYVTGEGDLFTQLYAKEAGMNLVFAGHTATERPAMLRLGHEISQEFSDVAVLELPETLY